MQDVGGGLTATLVASSMAEAAEALQTPKTIRIGIIGFATAGSRARTKVC